MIFNITDYNNFKDIKIWKNICDKAFSVGKSIKRNNSLTNSTDRNYELKPIYFLVGNKTDLKKRAVNESNIQFYCDTDNIYQYIETSAYTGEDVR